GVGLRLLAAHGQAAPVADAAVAADLRQALDVLRALAAQVALDRELLVDGVAQLADLLFGEVADVGVGRDPRLRQQAVRGRAPDPVDVGEADLGALVERQVHACDAGHASALPLLVTRVLADHEHMPVTADDLALLAHRLDR